MWAKVSEKQKNEGKSPDAMQPTLLRNVYCLFTAIFLLTAGLLLLLSWPYIFDYLIKANMQLRPDNHLFHLWKKNPFPMTINFYMFNWTNPQDLLDTSVKPRFQEIGPYVFNEVKEKVNITWNDNGTVSFLLRRDWHFNEEKSVGSLDDEIVTANPILLTAGYQLQNFSSFMRRAFSISAWQVTDRVDLKKTVGETLFYGYDDPFLDMGKWLPSFMGITLPGFDKFGWFYTRNGSSTYEGSFNMATGENNVLGRLYEWNNSNRSHAYEGSCGEVRGSAGELFPPVSSKTSIEFFCPDACRYIPLDYDEDVVVNGILGNKFSAGVTMLDNGTEVPENRCFCGGNCVPSGVMNVSACKYGSPAFVSLPHFYGADEYYTNAVDGMNPQKEKHEMHITLEPTSGIAISVAARLQLNLLMQPYQGIGLLEDVPKIFFPVMWFEQTVKVPEDMTFEIKVLLMLPSIMTAFSFVLITIAGFVVIITAYKAFWRRTHRLDYKTTIILREVVPLKEKSDALAMKTYKPSGVSMICNREDA